MTISININDEDATETLLINVGSIKSRLNADKSLSNHLMGFSGLSGSNGLIGLSQSGISTSDNSSHFGLQ